MRIPVLDNTEDVPNRAVTRSRALNRHKRSITDHTLPREFNVSTDSSDLECEWPTRPYRKFVENIIQRRERHSADGTEHLEAISPSDVSHTERGNSPVDHGPDVALETDSGSLEIKVDFLALKSHHIRPATGLFYFAGCVYVCV